MKKLLKETWNDTSKRRILITDCDKTTLKTASWILLGMGFEVITLENGADAFEKVLKAPHAFSLIVTGANPLEFSGLDLIKSIRHIPATAHIPILLTSLNPLMELALAEQEYSNTSFAPKPLYEELLHQEVDWLLAGEYSQAVPVVV